MKFWAIVYIGIKLFINGLVTALSLWFINFLIITLGFASGFFALLSSDNITFLILGLIISIAILILQFFISGYIGKQILKIK